MCITYIYTRVRIPTDNGVNERFNRSLKEEFMEVDPYFEPYLYERDLKEANTALNLIPHLLQLQKTTSGS